MENTRVCLIDSGVGGISILNECKKIMPQIDFLMVVDNKNCPYGNKSKTKICKTLEKLILEIHKKTEIRYFVLACNTATATSIQHLRKKYENLCFIGTEPAIKPAMQESGKTLLLSTVATKKHSAYLKSIKDKSHIIFAPQKNLAHKIDENLDNLWALYYDLDYALSKFKKMDIKNIVLGCTHYSFITPQISKIFPNAEIFDSSKGVANRLHSILKLHRLLNTDNQGNISLCLTQYDAKFKTQLLKEILKQ